MHKFLRFCHKNRLKIFVMIFAIILGWLMLQVVNNAIRKENEKENYNNQETTSNNVVSYSNESKAIISGGSVSKKYNEDLAKIVNQFYTYCINHEPQRAYEMLSDDNKRIAYQTEELFEELYYKSKFEGDKQFSFQAWSNANSIYIYQVKIYDNMLSTGRTNDNYIEDFVTIVPDGGSYKLNINSYLGTEEIYEKTENDKMSLEVSMVDKYLDYEVYTFKIKNKTDKNMIIDTRMKNDTCYIVDNLGNEFEAILYENTEEEMKFVSQESKTIKIKFNNAYRDLMEIKSVHFEDIVYYYNDYINDEDLQRDIFEIEI